MFGLVLAAAAAMGQSSSLAGGGANVDPPPGAPMVVRESGGQREAHRNAALEEASFVAVVLPQPRSFRVHDLLTVIVQEKKQYEAEGRVRAKNEFDIEAKLEDWFRFFEDHRLGQEPFSRGKPGVDFSFELERRVRGDVDREERLVTRVQVEIIDVKPNGVLVFQAEKHIEHDEEDIRLTLTGKCRSEDVGPDNAVLSTKVAGLDIRMQHKGITKSVMERGWLLKLWDLVHPF